MQFQIQEEGEFKWVEQGDGEIIFLLHGLFGALSNFADTINFFSQRYKVVIPLLPLYRLEIERTSVTGMVDHVDEFVKLKVVLPKGPDPELEAFVSNWEKGKAFNPREEGTS